MLNVYMHLYESEIYHYVGKCLHDEVPIYAGMYSDETDALLFVDEDMNVPFKPPSHGVSYMGWIPDLDNLDKIVINSMFNDLPKITLVVKKEVIDGLSHDRLDSAGYSRATTTS